MGTRCHAHRSDFIMVKTWEKVLEKNDVDGRVSLVRREVEKEVCKVFHEEKKTKIEGPCMVGRQDMSSNLGMFTTISVGGLQF